MSNIHVEYRILEPKKVNTDLVKHIRGRYMLGPTTIITDNPLPFLSTFRKHWIREMSHLTKARASTLDMTKIARLSQELLTMKMLRFNAKVTKNTLADVYILSTTQLDLIPTDCATIYIHIHAQLAYVLNDLYPFVLNRDAIIIEYSFDRARLQTSIGQRCK